MKIQTREEAAERARYCSKELYGAQIGEVTIERIEQLPLFKEPKEGWLVLTSFKDEDGHYTLQLEFTFDGSLRRSQEVGRE